jgi:molybdopterin-binding protein
MKISARNQLRALLSRSKKARPTRMSASTSADRSTAAITNESVDDLDTRPGAVAQPQRLGALAGDRLKGNHGRRDAALSACPPPAASASTRREMTCGFQTARPNGSCINEKVEGAPRPM